MLSLVIADFNEAPMNTSGKTSSNEICVCKVGEALSVEGISRFSRACAKFWSYGTKEHTAQ
jgi:hypothetical protein